MYLVIVLVCCALLLLIIVLNVPMISSSMRMQAYVLKPAPLDTLMIPSSLTITTIAHYAKMDVKAALDPHFLTANPAKPSSSTTNSKSTTSISHKHYVHWNVISNTTEMMKIICANLASKVVQNAT